MFRLLWGLFIGIRPSLFAIHIIFIPPSYVLHTNGPVPSATHCITPHSPSFVD